MSELEKFIAEQKAKNTVFAAGFDEGKARFKPEEMCRSAREQAGLIQVQAAKKLGIARSRSRG